MTDKPTDQEVPEPPPGVNHVDLWYEVGRNSVKLDTILAAIEPMEKRVSSLEKTRTQVYTVGALLSAGVASAIAFAQTIMEYMKA